MMGAGGRGVFKPMGRTKGKTPRGNKRQNSQIDAIADMFGLSEKQREQLHREIGGQGLGMDEIIERAEDMFNKKLW